MNEWTFPAWAGLVCLYLIIALAFVGLVSQWFDDNWMQTLGLIGLTLWALGRQSILRKHIAEGDFDISAYQFLSHVSLVLYGFGTAWKSWKYRKKT
jgi:hypothetical protein